MHILQSAARCRQWKEQIGPCIFISAYYYFLLSLVIYDVLLLVSVGFTFPFSSMVLHYYGNPCGNICFTKFFIDSRCWYWLLRILHQRRSLLIFVVLCAPMFINLREEAEVAIKCFAFLQSHIKIISIFYEVINMRIYGLWFCPNLPMWNCIVLFECAEESSQEYAMWYFLCTSIARQ